MTGGRDFATALPLSPNGVDGRFHKLYHLETPSWVSEPWSGLTETMETLNDHLARLERADLVRVSADIDLAYHFNHALTQEMAYQSLLTKRRREIHLRVAKCYERLYSDQLDDYAALLARHYAEAGDDEKTLEYATRAGEIAARTFANMEAIASYTRALDAARRIGAPLAKLYRARGQVYETLGDFERARSDFESGQQSAHEASDGAAEWQSLIDLGFVWLERDYGRSGDYFQQADALALRLGDHKLHAHSLNRIGNWLVNTGEPARGLAAHREALEIFETLSDKQGTAETHDLLGMASDLKGDDVTGVEEFGRAVQLFRELGDMRGLISSLTSIGASGGPAFGETVPNTELTFDQASSCLIEALRLSRQIGWQAGQAYAEFAMGWSASGFGEFGSALVHAREALRISTEIEHEQWKVASYYTLAQIYHSLLDTGAAIDYLQKAMPLANEIGSAWWIGNITAYLALSLTHQGRFGHAAKVLKAVIPRDHDPRNLQERRMVWAWGELALAEGKPKIALEISERLLRSARGSTEYAPVPTLLRLKGDALLILKRPKEAVAVLQAAKQDAASHGARPVLWQVHRSLANVYRRLRKSEEAELEFGKAREVINFLGETIGERDIRERFLKTALDTLPGTKKTQVRKAKQVKSMKRKTARS